MKAKKFNKKLSFNKQTVSNLNFNQMSDIYGGADTEGLTVCETRCATNCIRTCSACVMTCFICQL
jgi:hypothetical protein